MYQARKGAKPATLYAALEAARPRLQMDNHESDLYVKVSAVSTRIIEQWPVSRQNATQFVSQRDGERWWEVPWAYIP